ncbi:MAG TPA: hypothetical protein PKD72_02260, partial [Gemmatales bacterium]|nr:hypothetical protein [Gemmatales bacterium]
MRQRMLLLTLCLCSITGCKSLFNTSENHGGGNFSTPRTAQEVGAHLNNQSNPIQTVESDNVDITVTQNGQPFGLSGRLAFQKARNFRMVASAVGSTEADLGSNDQEFWFWMKRNEPPDLFYCSYNDLPTAQVKLPLQPDWIAEALCVQELNPADYQMRELKNGIELIREVQVNGEKLYKGILIARQGPNAGRIVLHRLFRYNTISSQEIWRAEVVDYQLQKDVGNYVVPYHVKVTCPEQSVAIEMKIKGCRVNQLQPNPQLFSKPA